MDPHGGIGADLSTSGRGRAVRSAVTTSRTFGQGERSHPQLNPQRRRLRRSRILPSRRWGITDGARVHRWRPPILTNLGRIRPPKAAALSLGDAQSPHRVDGWALTIQNLSEISGSPSFLSRFRVLGPGGWGLVNRDGHGQDPMSSTVPCASDQTDLQYDSALATTWTSSAAMVQEPHHHEQALLKKPAQELGFSGVVTLEGRWACVATIAQADCGSMIYCHYFAEGCTKSGCSTFIWRCDPST
jgi:hypothetical protein